MCGIIGYAGNLYAPDVITSGLKRLEYRGYDSAGVSVFVNEEIVTLKAVGRIKNLQNLIIENKNKLNSNVGIGHTRWATHGKPSELNAHPIFTNNVSVVHNGIIENYMVLKEDLKKKGYNFKTETDTEIIVNLLDYYYKECNPVEAIAKTVKRLEGAYALAIMFKGSPNNVYGVRKECPLLVALGNGENFIASDMNAVVEYTNKYYDLEPYEIVEISKNAVQVMDLDGNKISKQVNTVDWDITVAEKCGYEHFMLKEINEQPQVVMATILPRILNGLPYFNKEDITDDYLKQFKKIYIVACGTAMHAGMVGKVLIEKFAKIPVEVDVASEFRYRDPILKKDDLLIVISQSGETADTLAALRLAKQKGVSTIAVVNVNGSSIAREADKVILTFAGPEIAVASTKAYSVQLAVMYLLAIKLGLTFNIISDIKAKEYIKIFQTVPALMNEVIANSDHIKDIALLYQNTENIFFLGRGLDYAISLEGALKLKEISYIHCQPYQAGELKHGTISLITDGVPVVCIATQEQLFEKMVSNVKEVKARGAKTIFVMSKNLSVEAEIADSVICIPNITDDIFAPLIAVPALQLLAYHMAVIKGCDVDRPRNLAKSVTVE